jgi:hypothetical protein
MINKISIKDYKKKDIYPLGEEFQGSNPTGEQIGFTNYYMTKNQTPFYGISGEFHFSRCHESRWEDEIIKMKMCKINIIATYIFWIHHEEEEGIFDFSGCRNLRKFIELCGKHGIYVIIRIGPFDHGEVRNGGLPDWLYGKPFEVRKLSDEFLFYTKRLYAKIYEQIEGMLYKDGGCIIATQIDNEYMHSSAPWEITTGISNEWVFRGDEGEKYMLTLQHEAKKCGIITPFYTCTAWGGAITPSAMMPLWGGYAYRPWLFYAERGEHPTTEEYVYQDFHHNHVVATSDFVPSYEPESRPYACCEMGGGMTCTYNYRFSLPFKSVDAMSNIKIASGCNFLGYYVFQGGTNPKGKHGTFLNESQVPKMSYDYQAPLGEFGQVRESYNRLKTMHLFCETYSEELCSMGTVLPDGASHIEPKDLKTLRFALRTNGKSGFLFINNFQDHEKTMPKRDVNVTIQTDWGNIDFHQLNLDADENCILPFHLDVNGIELIQATAQPVTKVEHNKKATYVFIKPEGMKTVFTFEPEAITSQSGSKWICDEHKAAELFQVKNQRSSAEILCLNRELADQLYVLKDGTLLFAKGAVLEDEQGIRLEANVNKNVFYTYPRGHFHPAEGVNKVEKKDDIFDIWTVDTPKKELTVQITQTAAGRYVLTLPQNFTDGLKDVLMQIQYQGDIGHAFIDGDMINDNFCNGETWEIGLRTFADRLQNSPMTIVITPLKEGVNVNVESAMAARMEEVKAYIGNLDKVKLSPVYEVKLR